MTPGAPPLVLVGFAQAYAAVETIWSLQRAGLRVATFSRRGVSAAALRIRDLTVLEITAPEDSTSAAVVELESVLRSSGAAAFLPLDDASLWLAAQVDSDLTGVGGPDAAGIAFALDKHAQVKRAEQAGLAVPEWEYFEQASSATTSRWPTIVKPADAVRADGDRLVRPRGAICANASEFEAITRELHSVPVLTQAYVSGVGEGLFGLAQKGVASAWSGHRRVRMMNPHGSAASACESTDPDSATIPGASAILHQLAWSGMFMFEFLRDAEGTPWFMELNGRAWGSLALARRRGFEYPAWAVQSALGLPLSPEPPHDAGHVVARHLGRELAHLAFVVRGPQSDAVMTWPTLRSSLGGMLHVTRRDRLYNWNSRQPSVLVVDTLGTLADLAAGRRRTKP